jgi:predicted anti-sigma-YlaC factor YlaD
MDCSQVRIRLADYSAQQLSIPEAGDVASHLEGCKGCRLILAEENTLLEGLRRVERAEPARDLWADIRQQLPAQRAAKPWRLRLGLGLAASAALASLSLALVPRAPAPRPVTVSATSLSLLKPDGKWTVDDPLKETVAPLEALTAANTEDSGL